ncbi:hypothetical protein [Fusobacterium sp.]|uniref:major outer membrane protein FomA n=1 Tax=Fusobacterium sp. TaxID=68766 RepID=UPI0025C1EB86|nr:hypothetical protein [Fusobacterium sp.]MCI7222927.1 hypothetical protein [Fusobacterium sp.]
MKKLALVLGSLLVVGTAASAKEVVPAPVVVPEKVVEIVEKPVIVYRDREVAPAWRPNGSVDIQYRWYGEAEKKTNQEDTDDDWAGDKRTNVGRLQGVSNINFTENQTLNIRYRGYNTLRSENSSNGSLDELRLRHFYNFGNLGTSKVNLTSRVEYKTKANDGGKFAEASLGFNFADYFFANDYFKVSDFTVRPLYAHGWSGHGDNSSYNRYGLNLESTYELPLGFSIELNLYGRYNRKLSDNRYSDGRKSDLNLGVEAYLYNTTNLYKNGSFGVDFTFEGGYDEYTIHRHKLVEKFKSTEKERASYELYALPALQVSYKPTDFVKLYAAAGAEYRNWALTANSEAKNWRWQPTAWAGMKVSF